MAAELQQVSDARRRLFTLYGARVPMAVTGADIDLVVERTAGMTASFVKELLRRAVLVVSAASAVAVLVRAVT